jgi:serine/threonine-protein kinase
MSLCQECGSEVSEADVFCPYCGISLPRSSEQVPAVIVDDDSMESTIMMSPEEAANYKSEVAHEPSKTAENPDIFGEPKTADNILDKQTAPTLEDIPTPSILSSGFARPTDPDVAISGIHNAEQIQDEPLPTQYQQETPEPIQIEADAPPVPPSADLAYSAGDSPDEPVRSDAADSLGAADVGEDPNLQIDRAREEPAGVDQLEDTSISQAAYSGDISMPEEPTPSGESAQGISKPLVELEDAPPRPSMFDSVRIMESEAGNADSIDTMIPGRNMFVPESRPTTPPVVTPIVENTPASTPPQQPSARIGTTDTDGRKGVKLKPLPEGTVLNGRYEIVRKIGGGGMGAVYLASDNNLGGVLRAVKEMVQAHIEEEQQEKAINDFKRESMILSTLDHPSIPTIYDYFFDAGEGRFYLVMKYISGGDLASKLRTAPEGKIDELTVAEWAIQITDVLNYLHNQPTTIVYRDLKPSNIMLDGNSGRVMLIDFGIARNISQREEKGVTAVGTMGYAPPELFSGNVEPRSDIYSLGSTMFHLLTGADPQSNPLLIFDFQKNPRPRQINSRLSDQMERILMRAVEYNAEARFGSAAEMKAVLEEHLAKLRTGNVTYGVSEAPVSVSLANQSVFCGFCGQRIVATDLFCAFCGAKQPIAQQGVHSEIYQKGAAPTARLVIEGTSELSAPIYALHKDENLIGRRDPMSNIFPEVDLSKYDPQTKISRRHAKIWRDGTAFMLEDLGSSNGTMIEGTTHKIFRLPAHQPYKLTSGDRIKIGDTRLHFVVS